MTTTQKLPHAQGTLFWDDNLLNAYNLARLYAGDKGKVATMSDIVEAKTVADEWSPLWTNYITTTSGEFYGKSAGGVSIVAIVHGIDSILQNEEIMKRSTENLRENNKIQLTSHEFRKLETGAYGPVKILPHSIVANMREYPSSVLSYEDAMIIDPLLFARLGPKAADFLKKHKEITMKESGNDYILVNDHQYPYSPRENTGGLITMSQLRNFRRCGEPSGVSTEIDLSNLTNAARFIAMNKKGFLASVSQGLDKILNDLGTHWKKLTVSSQSSQKDLYVLCQKGNEYFTQYMEEDDVMQSGIPEFHVKKFEEIAGPETFTTDILGYHGFFKYRQEEVKKICPSGANAYFTGDPQIVWKDEYPVQHIASIQFFRVEVDTSKRILRSNEIKGDIGLIKKLLS
ncbi:MAG: hypothetical protein AABX16_03150 [Nanoarchaeota archaeon]